MDCRQGTGCMTIVEGGLLSLKSLLVEGGIAFVDK